MSLVVKVSINDEPPLEVVTAQRLLAQEAADMPWTYSGLQFYEVTRYSRQDGGGLEQTRPAANVYHDPEDGAIRLAYVALESVQEGETRDEAWLDAKREADAEIDEVIEQKDAFIEKQAAIINACMDVFTAAKAWNVVPEALYEELRNYV